MNDQTETRNKTENTIINQDKNTEKLLRLKTGVDLWLLR
jgi:hypothetical protein